MFAWLKKKAPAESGIDQLRALGAEATETIKAKWVQFHNTVHLKADVPLVHKIEIFIGPIHEFYKRKYPVLAEGPAEVFWLTAFTAILESGTHPKTAINAAIEQLRSKRLS